MNTLKSSYSRRGRAACYAAAVLTWLAPQLARACSVCYGDPDSDMARGAVYGVAFMIGIVAFVLVGIASITGVWIVRARRLARDVDIENP
jgi:hypothetical protein